VPTESAARAAPRGRLDILAVVNANNEISEPVGGFERPNTRTFDTRWCQDALAQAPGEVAIVIQDSGAAAVADATISFIHLDVRIGQASKLIPAMADDVELQIEHQLTRGLIATHEISANAQGRCCLFGHNDGIATVVGHTPLAGRRIMVKPPEQSEILGQFDRVGKYSVEYPVVDQRDDAIRAGCPVLDVLLSMPIAHSEARRSVTEVEIPALPLESCGGRLSCQEACNLRLLTAFFLEVFEGGEPLAWRAVDDVADTLRSPGIVLTQQLT
jgi:hypothetical protein